ncbi:hypothetical protein [Hydrogenispora ethanolica]|uniref:hypothetical protein n=1 Tax=Hydrogenispora ethanolica TaxID=1082276 RepID=UPI001046A308|nr:hypothetical protein [Hydrogenispora ethanolica]
MDSYIVSEEICLLTRKKANELKKIYSGFNTQKSTVLNKANTTYYYGNIGELWLCEYLKEKAIDFYYLNNDLQDDTTGDDGDMVIQGKKCNVKLQIFKSGIPNENWKLNLNYKDYKEDKEKGIEQYWFLLYNPNTNQVYFAGYTEYDEVPNIATFYEAGAKDYCHWPMYCIEINKLKKLKGDKKI